VASGPDGAETRFAGRMIGVTVERWGDAKREIVERSDSVAIAAVVTGAVVLVRQFREAARRELLELPAGTVDDGEEPLATARRELAEETGLRGGRWTPWPTVYTTPGFCRERVHLFLAGSSRRARRARGTARRSSSSGSRWTTCRTGSARSRTRRPWRGSSFSYVGAETPPRAPTARTAVSFAPACGSASSRRSSRTSIASR
jgi:ADP-ribose pyrophosphatase YjhB (NUDIX family)